MATVIVGAGIIGASTAYYLSQSPSSTPPSSIHIIESSPELFASASGYAAGFLARDWFSPPVATLGALSFDLHKQLAEENNGWEKWGYSRSTGTSLENRGGKRGVDWLLEGSSRAEAAGEHEFVDGVGPAWLTRRVGGKIEVISEDDSTAQVDPLRLSKFLLSTCLARGVHLHQPSKPTSIITSKNGTLTSIRLASPQDGSETTTIPCTRLVITAGAWTPRVFQTLFPTSKLKIPISSLAGHSLLIRSPRWKSGDDRLDGKAGCHAVFTTDDKGYSPEVFSRVGGEIYIAGLNDAALPLPEVATDRKIDVKSVDVLKGTAKRLLGKDGGEDDLEVLREGLCFRPVTRKGVPIVGRVKDEGLGLETKGGSDGGVWIAAGHGPWGISLSLGTGKCVAEMVEGRKTSADVGGLGL
ncbi:hypothetical protein MMC24_002690 [Lignoscripta atroalba]|nr:hypothetical protein [Lignoscripta atroalba]